MSAVVVALPFRVGDRVVFPSRFPLSGGPRLAVVVLRRSTSAPWTYDVHCRDCTAFRVPHDCIARAPKETES